VKAVRVPPDLLASLRRLADDAYPEECCGFVLSAADAPGAEEVRHVLDVVPAVNRSSDARRRRFVILPDELREAERRAAARGAVVSGFYHSHPDHPARPSRYDEDHAWPWYVYLILASGPARRSVLVGAYELDPDRREFHEVALTAAPTIPPEGAFAAR
jgi:proteasome lid subunit RPN8/RPN11